MRRHASIFDTCSLNYNYCIRLFYSGIHKGNNYLTEENINTKIETYMFCNVSKVEEKSLRAVACLIARDAGADYSAPFHSELFVTRVESLRYSLPVKKLRVLAHRLGALTPIKIKYACVSC